MGSIVVGEYPTLGLVEILVCVVFNIVFIIFMITNAVLGILIIYWIHYTVFLASKFCWLPVTGFMIGWFKSDLCFEILPYIIN
jgi:hypothetical protein